MTRSAVREQAAQLCSAMANLWAGQHDPLLSGVDVINALFGERGKPQWDIAFAALLETEGEPGAERWAEAEAMLRTGWSPTV